VGAEEAGALAPVEAPVKYHPGGALALTPHPTAGRRTAAGGEFDWGGRLLKCTGGAQRFPQAGWQSAVARKGTKGA
jgi:hypothetical protein